MDGYQAEITLIKRVLKENPKGMTVTDISRKIKINRNSVAKYLDIMRISGHVEMISFGPAKVFFPSRRVPLGDMLNYTSDLIVVLDKDFKITMINDAFLNFINLDRQDIIGEKITENILSLIKDEGGLLLGLQEAIQGRSYSQEIEIKIKKEKIFFYIKIIPATFEDGKFGAAIIFKNISEQKLAENALKESEENFKIILKKMNKR